MSSTLADTSLSSQAATSDGNGDFSEAGDASAFNNFAGKTIFFVTTFGSAEICEAWFKVMPVIAKPSMATRQIAELIQCH